MTETNPWGSNKVIDDITVTSGPVVENRDDITVVTTEEDSSDQHLPSSTSETDKNEESNKRTIILDTGAIIEGNKIGEIIGKEMDLLSIEFLTTPGVFREIKTSKAKRTLNNLPFKLNVVSATEESTKMVCEYAKLSGDYGALSSVDIEVVALSLDAERQHHGNKHLKPKPKAFKLSRRKVELTPYPGSDKPREYVNRTRIEIEKQKEAIEKRLAEEEAKKKKALQGDNESDSEYSDDSDSDSDGWITPQNVKQKVEEENEFLGLDHKEEHWSINEGESRVGCMTTDFAMQNVILTMGMTLINSTGYRIRGIRRYVLRCTSCYMMEPDTSIKFCENCGNHGTLRRIECVMQENGEPVFYYNPRFKFNLRGTKFNIPKPQGGKKNNDPVLREDQQSRYRNRTGVQYSGKKTRQRAKLMNGSSDYWSKDYHFESTFGGTYEAQDDLKKSEWSSKDSYYSGYNQRNPNSWSKRKFKKKKRN